MSQSTVERDQYGHKELRTSISAGANGNYKSIQDISSQTLIYACLCGAIEYPLVQHAISRLRYSQGCTPDNHLNIVDGSIPTAA